MTLNKKYRTLFEKSAALQSALLTSVHVLHKVRVATSSTKQQNVKSNAGGKKVTVSWDAVDVATSYIIYSYTSTGGYKSEGTTKNTTYTVSGLTNGAKHGFLVKTYVGGAWSKWSSADLVYTTPNA